MILDRLLSPKVSFLLQPLSNGQAPSFLQHLIQLCPRLKLESVRFDIFQVFDYGGSAFMAEIHQLSQTICTQEHLEVYVLLDGVALRRVMLSSQLGVAVLLLHPTASNVGNICITSADMPFRNVKELELYVLGLPF